MEGSHAQQPRAVPLSSWSVAIGHSGVTRSLPLSLESGTTVQPPHAASRVVVGSTTKRPFLVSGSTSMKKRFAGRESGRPFSATHGPPAWGTRLRSTGRCTNSCLGAASVGCFEASVLVGRGDMICKDNLQKKGQMDGQGGFIVWIGVLVQTLFWLL